ncbi:hypothetical protein G5F42_001798 [Campylobacter upsaliensis]|nr:hypothetical protein [Campylobacter upsaliensis]EHA5322534.1 hypothetical protein [Campylobacter upsaliensis]EHJ8979000.1 hypothetical protein [Campylobacter upsaliensis]EKS7445557.1 hypothetical protein [Campylobacter upsaliensis]
MPNIRKRPTEIMTTRVPKSWLPFFKTLENRNNYVLQLIENSQEYKDYLRKKAEQDNKNQPSLF